MKVIVTGGRDFNDRVQVFRVLDGMLGSITTLIQGGAKGADHFALEWAVSRKIPLVTFPALWRKYGHSAGRKRNRLMLFENQDATVVAFKGGTGTAHCVETAKQLNMKVILIKDNV